MRPKTLQANLPRGPATIRSPESSASLTHRSCAGWSYRCACSRCSRGRRAAHTGIARVRRGSDRRTALVSRHDPVLRRFDRGRSSASAPVRSRHRRSEVCNVAQASSRRPARVLSNWGWHMPQPSRLSIEVRLQRIRKAKAAKSDTRTSRRQAQAQTSGCAPTRIGFISVASASGCQADGARPSRRISLNEQRLDLWKACS